MIHKRFGAIPTPGPLQPVDEELLATVRAGFDSVGQALAQQRFGGGIGEVMRIVGEANAYVSKTEPFKLKADSEQERLGTVLHTLAQAVSDLNLLMSPFLPHSANRVHAVLGRTASHPDAAAERRGGSRRRTGIPGHHGRLQRRPALGVHAGGAGHPDRSADPGLHQARPVGRRRAGPDERRGLTG